MNTEILKEIGLTAEQIAKVFELNGKDVNRLNDKVKALEAEKADIAGQLETVNDTLKSYDGITPESFKALQDELNAARKDYEQKIYERDYNDILNGALSAVEFSSPYARDGITAKIRNELKLEGGKIFKVEGGNVVSLEDYLENLKTAEPEAFKTETARRITVNTGPTGTQANPGLTLDDIARMKTENPQLDIKAMVRQVLGGKQ